MHFKYFLLLDENIWSRTVQIDIKDYRQKTKILMHFYLNYLHKIKIGCIWAETQPLTLIFVWALWIYCHRLTLKVCPTKLSKNCLWILVRLDQSEVSITTLSTNHSSPGHTRGEVGPVLQQRHHLPCKVHILYIWSLPLYQ